MMCSLLTDVGRRQLRAFRDATVPILQDSLDEDARAVKDHVRLLHASVEEACREHDRARAASAVPWLKTPASLRADVEAGECAEAWRGVVAEDATEYERRTFLAAAALRPPGDAGDAERLGKRRWVCVSARWLTMAVAGTVRGEQGRVEDGLRRVLGRKLDKSRVGDGLVADVRVLVDEIQTVTSVF